MNKILNVANIKTFDECDVLIFSRNFFLSKCFHSLEEEEKK